LLRFVFSTENLPTMAITFKKRKRGFPVHVFFFVLCLEKRYAK